MTCDEWWADISVIFWFLIFVASLLDSNLQWMPHHNKLSGHSKWFLGWIHISVTLIFSYLAHFNAITVWLSYSLRLKNQLLFRLYHLQLLSVVTGCLNCILVTFFCVLIDFPFVELIAFSKPYSSEEIKKTDLLVFKTKKKGKKE